ncbi:MAG: hypothetical protein A3I89_00695 [Candidatus Harrisonbacteria bacterium RIFCSPLOWO2_02_FULL_41_11]|uniref:Uncharacterized protein n=1 Tax=Candidatus Harrisonbacteria bacterium RIFCSPHIGHO2_02_FULL_42_16 TaxID=1798404 RepID=A0A1G1ZGE2_9BACT|nr:MAG: hypothetical protein A3B92_03920 [Candidatus Harrisonbacteria bacterium RIFCSPHIGHO2_02_FULL_42_16]OGY67287.1 MAG: hypothetical protein A3I89_00695 [Candidatus Harrisonbacteria bacterium RIFCSPLOWO2_02_FULL_41_11]
MKDWLSPKTPEEAEKYHRWLEVNDPELYKAIQRHKKSKCGRFLGGHLNTNDYLSLNNESTLPFIAVIHLAFCRHCQFSVRRLFRNQRWGRNKGL